MRKSGGARTLVFETRQFTSISRQLYARLCGRNTAYAHQAAGGDCHLLLGVQEVPKGRFPKHLINSILHGVPQGADGAIDRMGANFHSTGVTLAELRFKEAPAQRRQYFSNVDFF